MSLKTIKVNPIFLATSGGGGNSGKNKTRKEKPVGVSLGQSNTIKKKLIARIKDFQHNKKEPTHHTNTNNNNNNNILGNNNDNNDNNIFKDEFSNSMQFLDNLARNKEEQKINKRNTTLKRRQMPDPNAYMQIATELPPELQLDVPAPVAPAPVAPVPVAPVPVAPVPVAPVPTNSITWSPPPQPLYSNLKNSGRPTYRTWLRNTQKNKPVPPNNKPLIFIESESSPQTNIELGGVEGVTPQTNVAIEGTTPQTNVAIEGVGGVTPQTITVMGGATPRRKKITRTFKYKLGKHPNGKVSVLIKNAQTRRKIQTEQSLLKRKSILDIKNHLRSKNLLKVGSDAPNDVLREIYEQSILAGQIENKSKDTLIHNYFNGDK